MGAERKKRPPETGQTGVLLTVFKDKVLEPKVQKRKTHFVILFCSFDHIADTILHIILFQRRSAKRNFISANPRMYSKKNMVHGTLCRR